MATNTAQLSPPPRHNGVPVVQYLRRDITYLNDGQTVDVGTLPAGSIILSPISGMYVTTIFNGGGNNYVDIGASTDSGTNNLATQLSGLSIAFVVLAEVATAGPLIATDTKIVALVTSTSSPSAGAATIVIAFVEDNDL